MEIGPSGKQGEANENTYSYAFSFGGKKSLPSPCSRSFNSNVNYSRAILTMTTENSQAVLLTAQEKTPRPATSTAHIQPPYLYRSLTNSWRQTQSDAICTKSNYVTTNYATTNYQLLPWASQCLSHKCFLQVCHNGLSQPEHNLYY